jgi:non-homologous end joining protein Ku
MNTHIKMRKLLQICKQVVARLLSNQYQDVFALLVPSCCDKSGTSCYHLVRRLMTVTDLLQVVPTRLIQAVRNKLLRACCHQLVNNLLRADDIRLVGTTCCDNAFTHTKISHLVASLPTSRQQVLFALLVTSWTTCWNNAFTHAKISHLVASLPTSR